MTNTTRQSRRRAKRRTRQRPPILQIPFTQLRNRYPPFEILSPEQVEEIHQASLQILEITGIHWLDEEALRLWEQAGAKVDWSEMHAWLDRALVMELVSRAPSSFTWRARNPHKNLLVGQDSIVFVPTAGAVYAANQDIGRRPGLLKDYENLQKLNHLCNCLHSAGEGLVEMHDVEVAYRHLYRQNIGYTLTDKAMWASLHGDIICEDNLNMARIVFGDDLTTGGPVIGGVINVNSPLVYDKRMLRGLIQTARAGQFSIVTPFVLAGSMSPVTLAAASAQQNAEALAGIALTQLINPGSPVVYGAFLTNVDLKTGSPAFGSPEEAIAIHIGAQMARRYNLPHRGSGTLTSSNVADCQAASESNWTLWPTVLSHTNLVLHAAGWLESGLTFSYEKFILDVENLAMMSHYLRGITIDEANLALDSIHEVGPAGHHLDSLLTQSQFENAFYTPSLAERQNLGTWKDAGGKNSTQRAYDLWQQMLQEYQPPPLDEAIRDELQDYVSRRERELSGVNLYEDA